MRTAKPKLVTRDSLQNMIDHADAAKRMHIVGRALKALYARQTPREQACQGTIELNNRGFSGCDAEIGSSHATYYTRNGYLTPKQLNIWLKKKQEKGYCRLSRYWKQLNEVAIQKASEAQAKLVA